MIYANYANAMMSVIGVAMVKPVMAAVIVTKRDSFSLNKK